MDDDRPSGRGGPPTGGSSAVVDGRPALGAPNVLVVSVAGCASPQLADALRAEGCAVVDGTDDVPPIELIEQHRPEVVIVQGEAATPSVLDLLRVIRERSAVPLVVVSASNEELDAVLALELGADEFVGPPVRYRELVARVRALLRRASAAADTAPRMRQLRGGDVSIDLAGHEVTVRGQVLHLPLREFEVLALLVEHGNRVLARETILRRIWGAHFAGDPKTLDVHIKRLREKIELDPAKPIRIVTVRGVGYRFVTAD